MDIGPLSSTAFEALLHESVRIHGHLCPGQVLGVRMAIYGLAGLGLTDPKGKDRKKLLLIVEIDRCATDALQSVTGCSLGKRSMKFMYYGKMAATFANLETGKALRVVAREDARAKARDYFPEIENQYVCQLEAYKIMSDEELFYSEQVAVKISEDEMPGARPVRARCERCGEWFYLRNGHCTHLCRSCRKGSYYTRLSSSGEASYDQPGKEAGNGQVLDG
ncbi:MAG: FmdE family protein [Nitrospiraceae bacterium]|nr:FmdE family protein [Nitrospiraceae bacterium]MDA8088814.1 FmdE family protein [Nitrospiraceae bacterium]